MGLFNTGEVLTFSPQANKGFFELRYIRTKEMQEVDFCVLRDRKIPSTSIRLIQAEKFLSMLA